MLPALGKGVLNAASDTQLLELYDQLPSVLAAAKATNTWKRYTPMWDRFKQWCQGTGVSFLPAEPIIVALYLLMLMQIAGSFNTIKCASAAIAAFHQAANLCSPTASPIVGSIREAAKRMQHAGVNKKEPLSWDAVVQIAQKALEPAATLKQLLIATIISVGFCGFFRYDDLSKITVDLVLIYRSHMEVFLESRKNDQYREGHWIPISYIPGCKGCPMLLTMQLIERAGLSGGRPLFSAVTLQEGKEVYGQQPISYSCLRGMMLTAIADIGLPVEAFGTHSLRAGGATLAANRGVPDRVWMEHGGWKSSRAAAGYVKSSREVKLSVTHSMFGRPSAL